MVAGLPLGQCLTSGFLLNANLPLSIGFVNIPAFLISIPITSFMARIGANMVHTTDKNKTQRMFGVFLYVIGTLFLYRYLQRYLRVISCMHRLTYN